MGLIKPQIEEQFLRRLCLISAVETVKHPLEVPLSINSFENVFSFQKREIGDQRPSEIPLHYGNSCTAQAWKLTTHQVTKTPHRDNSFIAHARIHELKRSTATIGRVTAGYLYLWYFLDTTSQ